VRGEFLDLHGTRLYYYAAGNRGAGEPVLFLHGFPTSSHLWSDVVPLMPAGHRIVVLDLLGYGRSDRPHSEPVDVPAHADRVAAVLDELRIERACIVGHGVGGGIAQSLAVRHASRVSGLGLIHSIGFDHGPTLAAPLPRAALPAARFLPPEIILGMVRRDLSRGYSDAARAAHSLDQYLRPFAGADGRTALLSHVRALTGGDTAKLATQVTAQLPAVRVPTAIVWGQHDPVTRLGDGRRLRDAIPGATLEVIPDARHFTPNESPRQIADAVGELLAR
jgi:pimeloyl-ACP methyl ester carboxylesterase